MPFSETKPHHTEEYWTRHFEVYLKPLIKKVKNVEAFRSEPLRGNIANQIITDLTNSDIVVADLTDHNPNVLWELGVRQSFKNCTITIAEKGTNVPFHFSHKGILFYNGDHLSNEKFEKDFKKSIEDCIRHPELPDSPVLETLGGRGTLYAIVNNEENQRKLQVLEMEIAENENAIKEIIAYCKENKSARADGKKVSMIAYKLKKLAFELLYANRYLDLPIDFYKKVLVYINNVEAYNEQLSYWSDADKSCEDWLLSNEDKISNAIIKIKKFLNEMKKEYSN